MSKNYCENCGAILSENSNFCGSCGHKLYGDSNNEIKINNESTLNSNAQSNASNISTDSKKSNSFFKSKKYKITTPLLPILVIVVLLGIFFLISSSLTMSGSDVPLEEHYYNFLTISVPKGSDFFIDSDLGNSMALKNNAGYKEEARAILTQQAPGNDNTGYFEFQNKTGDVSIYKHSTEDYYRVDRIVDGYRVIVIGTDLDLIIRMVETAKCD